jgi:hypothetical protein
MRGAIDFDIGALRDVCVGDAKRVRVDDGSVRTACERDERGVVIGGKRRGALNDEVLGRRSDAGMEGARRARRIPLLYRF